MTAPSFTKQILVAGVGNAWLQDDAFGGECARRLEAEGAPDGTPRASRRRAHSPPNASSCSQALPTPATRICFSNSGISR